MNCFENKCFAWACLGDKSVTPYLQNLKRLLASDSQGRLYTPRWGARLPEGPPKWHQNDIPGLQAAKYFTPAKAWAAIGKFDVGSGNAYLSGGERAEV